MAFVAHLSPAGTNEVVRRQRVQDSGPDGDAAMAGQPSAPLGRDGWAPAAWEDRQRQGRRSLLVVTQLLGTTARIDSGRSWLQLLVRFSWWVSSKGPDSLMLPNICIDVRFEALRDEAKVA